LKNKILVDTKIYNNKIATNEMDKDRRTKIFDFKNMKSDNDNKLYFHVKDNRIDNVKERYKMEIEKNEAS